MLTTAEPSTNCNPLAQYGLTNRQSIKTNLDNICLATKAAWFNQDCRLIGQGDLSNRDLERIAEVIQPGHLFIALPPRVINDPQRYPHNIATIIQQAMFVVSPHQVHIGLTGPISWAHYFGGSILTAGGVRQLIEGC